MKANHQKLPDCGGEMNSNCAFKRAFCCMLLLRAHRVIVKSARRHGGDTHCELAHRTGAQVTSNKHNAEISRLQVVVSHSMKHWRSEDAKNRHVGGAPKKSDSSTRP